MYVLWPWNFLTLNTYLYDTLEQIFGVTTSHRPRLKTTSWKIMFFLVKSLQIWNCITFVLWKVWPPNFSQKLISTRQEKEHIILLIMMSLREIMTSWRILQNLLRLRGIKIFKNIMKAIYSDKKWNYIQLFQHHLASYQLLFLFKFSNLLGFYFEKILTSGKFERRGAQV